MSLITDRINEQLNYLGLSRADMCRFTGISESTIRNWIRGTSPQAEMLFKVARFLNVSLEYLITGKKDESKKSKIELSDFEKSLLDEVAGLLPEDKVELMAYIEMKKTLYRTLRGDNGKLAIVKDC